MSERISMKVWHVVASVLHCDCDELVRVFRVTLPSGKTYTSADAIARCELYLKENDAVLQYVIAVIEGGLAVDADQPGSMVISVN